MDHFQLNRYAGTVVHMPTMRTEADQWLDQHPHVKAQTSWRRLQPLHEEEERIRCILSNSQRLTLSSPHVTFDAGNHPHTHPGSITITKCFADPKEVGATADHSMPITQAGEITAFLDAYVQCIPDDAHSRALRRDANLKLFNDRGTLKNLYRRVARELRVEPEYVRFIHENKGWDSESTEDDDETHRRSTGQKRRHPSRIGYQPVHHPLFMDAVHERLSDNVSKAHHASTHFLPKSQWHDWRKALHGSEVDPESIQLFHPRWHGERHPSASQMRPGI
jgi:hypothetical protein